MKILFFVCMGAMTATLIACQPKSRVDEIFTGNRVEFGNKENVQTIGEGKTQFGVATVEQSTSERKAGSLILKYPASLLGTDAIFGGVITKVSNTDNENLGILKLSDIDAIHVVTKLVKDEKGNIGLGLFGCLESCTKQTAPELLIAFPVVGASKEEKTISVDLAAIGKEIDIAGMIGASSYFGLTYKSSDTVLMDFSKNTLVFDVESVYSFQNKEKPDEELESKLTTRFYLKPQAPFNKNFVSREPTDEVGFFTTNRSATTYISRWQETDGKNLVHYYLKNVPAEHKAAFAASFDTWNDLFQQTLGHKQLSYEFIDKDDSRAPLLVTGDIRYNIIEWDLVNRAPYGGLGPSIANQNTGELISANILIQGPEIERLYKAWFHVNDRVKSLRAQGEDQRADTLVRNFNREVSRLNVNSNVRHTIRLGKIHFRIPAEDPAYLDKDQKLFFDEIPQGYTYEKYMKGYFLDMVAHEMGHNMGLRHNFKGNLASDDTMRPGTVSRSIMEYLNKGYRYLDNLGDYDRMAIAYGYKGIKPDHDDWFCTDENLTGTSAVNMSAECSKDDATSDPFKFFSQRLEKMAGLIVDASSAKAPVWTQKDIDSVFNIAVDGMGLYATSAAFTGKTWLNFFNKQNRPANPDGVKKYVTDAFTDIVCDPTLDAIVSKKESEAAKKVAADNLKTFRLEVANELNKLNSLEKIFTPETIPCLPSVE